MKVPLHSDSKATSTKQEHDLRANAAQRLAPRFINDHSIEAGVVTADQPVKVPMQTIRVGDFVDVSVLCVIREDRRRRMLKIYWAPKEVMQLTKAAANKVILIYKM